MPRSPDHKRSPPKTRSLEHSRGYAVDSYSHPTTVRHLCRSTWKGRSCPRRDVNGAEEASQGYPPRIHGEVVGEFPLELCLYSDRRSGDDPSPAGIIALECRDDPLYQPGVCFRCRCFQLSAGPGIRVEFLARLDAQWKEHS